ncbi:hypothetical protein HPULCUR_011880 [Helicostylum pulchrum]|uniref:40S ribosomal protein S27 n=1 Tax=Helicostylum pulchrum TaxID=562976 RepID=A0ABP9YI13_9FUNG
MKIHDSTKMQNSIFSAENDTTSESEAKATGIVLGTTYNTEVAEAKDEEAVQTLPCRQYLSTSERRCTALAVDLLNPSIEHEKRYHKLKRLVQSPNSYFIDVKCPGCLNISTVFSHAQTVVLCQSTGGRVRLTEGCSFRRKAN